jgi:hypothetical protein
VYGIQNMAVMVGSFTAWKQSIEADVFGAIKFWLFRQSKAGAFCSFIQYYKMRFGQIDPFIICVWKTLSGGEIIEKPALEVVPCLLVINA